MVQGPKSPENANSEELQLQRAIADCRHFQYQRAAKLNKDLNNKELEVHCGLDATCEALFREAINKLSLSARASH